MKTVLMRLPFAVFAVALLAAPVAAFSQAQTPIREGNIWAWQDHQPTEAQVLQKERAAGVAPTPSQNTSEVDTLKQIYRQLLGKELYDLL